ncbi:unnamed protein product [Urochloa humidicola]
MEMETEEPSEPWCGEGGEATRGQFVADADDDDEEELAAAAADDDDDEEEYEGLELPTEEDDAERYDSDNGGGDKDEDEEDQPPRRKRKASDGESSRTNWKDMALVSAPAGLAVPEEGLAPLVPPRFAAAGNTAGFMRIAAEAAGSQEERGREIVVLYRYTRFSRASSGGRRGGVEACRRTKLHWLRFAVPPVGDMASSLAWAGASLSPLVYPALFRRELQDLWSTLAAPAAIAAAIPSKTAKRLQVVVDAGILRREDYTAERMDCVRGALEGIVGKPWPADYYHVGVELRLPEPVVRREEDDGGGAPPAKRRRIVGEEDCCVCLEQLERGLAAWPGCGHVFHGQCVEKTLAGSQACPLCRRKLSDTLVC